MKEFVKSITSPYEKELITLMRSSFASRRMEGSASPSRSSPFRRQTLPITSAAA